VIDPRIQRVVLHLRDEGVITSRELDAYALHAAGHGYIRISMHLGISSSTARDRVKRAQRKITIYFKEHPNAAA